MRLLEISSPWGIFLGSFCHQIIPGVEVLWKGDILRIMFVFFIFYFCAHMHVLSESHICTCCRKATYARVVGKPHTQVLSEDHSLSVWSALRIEIKCSRMFWFLVRRNCFCFGPNWKKLKWELPQFAQHKCLLVAAWKSSGSLSVDDGNGNARKQWSDWLNEEE